MAKWAGVIGFSHTEELQPDENVEVVIEKKFHGDLLKNTRRYETGENTTNDNFVIANSISVIVNDFMLTNLQYARYVMFQNIRWKIQSIDIEYPRVNFTLGGIYNGPTPRVEPETA